MLWSTKTSKADDSHYLYKKEKMSKHLSDRPLQESGVDLSMITAGRRLYERKYRV